MLSDWIQFSHAILFRVVFRFVRQYQSSVLLELVDHEVKVYHCFVGLVEDIVKVVS